MRSTTSAFLLALLIALGDACAPKANFKEDHPRRKERDEKFINDLVGVKQHEELLQKAVETLRQAQKAQRPDDEENVDYKAKITQIEQELRDARADHARLIAQHERFVETMDRPKTWGDTFTKYTGEAFGRMVYNTLCTAVVCLMPFVLRPLQRRWMLRRREQLDVDDHREGIDSASTASLSGSAPIQRLQAAKKDD